MNKTQLIEKMKKPEDRIDSLLSAAAISSDLKVYTNDHLKILQEIDKILESGKAKTDKEAAELYYQQQKTFTESDNLARSSIDTDEFIQSLANQAADEALANLPNIAKEEHENFRVKFQHFFRQRLAERLREPEFQQQFQLALEGKDVGKLKLLSSTT